MRLGPRSADVTFLCIPETTSKASREEASPHLFALCLLCELAAVGELPYREASAAGIGERPTAPQRCFRARSEHLACCVSLSRFVVPASGWLSIRCFAVGELSLPALQVGRDG